MNKNLNGFSISEQLFTWIRENIPEGSNISKHIGADAGTKSDYRLMKNEELYKASILFNKAVDAHPAKVEWDNRKIE